MTDRDADTQSAQELRFRPQTRATRQRSGAHRRRMDSGFGRWIAALALVAGVAQLSPAQAAPAWSELQGPLRGASYGEAGGIALFVLGCGAGSGPFIQAPLPEGVRPRPGRATTLALDVDGKRFSVRGRIAVDENAEGGPRGAVVAPVRLTDPLVKALGTGKQVKVGEGKANGGLVIPLSEGTALLAKAATICGAPAPVTTPAAPKPAEAAAAKPPEAAPTAAQAAPATVAAEPGKPARSGGVPPAREIAAAIFVDQAEGLRVADKLKITPVDLNGDGAPEAIITLTDPTWCGDTGCTWFVVDLSGKPRVMGQFIGLGLAPGKDSNDGWRDLSLKTPGGSERMYYKDGTYH
ncbi:hypothetical protein [Xanthobacter agilis]|uniref:hypothetical protein n=1 Tax=Xanthobacter agilis TaxID=47492 RepID=UPI00372CCA23